jgi:hypothetical protein
MTETFPAVRALLKEGKRDAARWQTVSDLTRLLFTEPSPAAAKYRLQGGAADAVWHQRHPVERVRNWRIEPQLALLPLASLKAQDADEQNQNPHR